uniref:Uncharacterized protein n=1 Tax=Arundo donax TaxID=35708 RepID=A0A0A9CAN4_ARUDO
MSLNNSIFTTELLNSVPTYLTVHNRQC